MITVHCFLFPLSTKQRIEAKRHRVCLEVPEEVVPKDEDDEDAQQYGKRPRLSLIPPRMTSQDCRKNKGVYLSIILLVFCTVAI